MHQQDEGRARRDLRRRLQFRARSSRRSGSASGTGSTGTTSPRSPTSPRPRRNGAESIVFGTLYVVGHAVVVLGLGIIAVLIGQELPASVDAAMGRIVGVTLIAPRRLRVRVADPARPRVPDAEPVDARLRRCSGARGGRIRDRRSSVTDAHDHEREPRPCARGSRGSRRCGRSHRRVASRPSRATRPPSPQAPRARRPVRELPEGDVVPRRDAARDRRRDADADPDLHRRRRRRGEGGRSRRPDRVPGRAHDVELDHHGRDPRSGSSAPRRTSRSTRPSRSSRACSASCSACCSCSARTRSCRPCSPADRAQAAQSAHRPRDREVRQVGDEAVVASDQSLELLGLVQRELVVLPTVPAGEVDVAALRPPGDTRRRSRHGSAGGRRRSRGGTRSGRRSRRSLPACRPGSCARSPWARCDPWPASPPRRWHGAAASYAAPGYGVDP